MAATESERYFRVQYWWLHSFKKVKICLHTKFRWDISIHGWDKTTSGFGQRTAAILEFYFDLDLCLVLRMWFCFSLSNFVIIRRSMAGLWRHMDFIRWRPQSQKSTSGFRFIDGTCLRKWITICIPNFDEISQCSAEINYFRFRKMKGRHIGIVLMASILTSV